MRVSYYTGMCDCVGTSACEFWYAGTCMLSTCIGGCAGMCPTKVDTDLMSVHEQGSKQFV